MAKQLEVFKFLSTDNKPRPRITIMCTCGAMWGVKTQSRITNFQCTDCKIQYEITKPRGEES